MQKKSTIRLILAVLLLTFGITTQAEIKTIKDVLGREVNVDVPVKNAVLGFYYPDYIAVTGVENFKYVKGISREFWEKFNPGSWALFSEKMPELKNIADIGQCKYGKTFSTVNNGTTADIFFTKNYPDVKLLKFEQNTETFEALRDGRGDALSNDNTFLFAWAKQNPGYTVGVKNFGDQDVIAPAVRKDAPELLNWLNNEIQTLGKNGRLKQAYEKTLLPVYGDTVNESDIVVEYK